MYLNEIYKKIISDLDIKFADNSLIREDLEKIFNFILNSNKILLYFSNDKLNDLKDNKLNFYLFFIAFIKNHISEISKYIESLDLDNEYTEDISKEIQIENNKLKLNLVPVSKKNNNFETLENISNNNLSRFDKYNNKELLEKVEYFLKLVSNNQSKDQENILKKYEKTFHELKEAEEKIKEIVIQTIEKRNKYLEYKNVLEKRFNQDLNLFDSIKNDNDSIDREIRKIEQSLEIIENKISEIIDNNQEIYQKIINDTYPKY